MEFLADPDHPDGKETRLLIKTQYKHQHGQTTSRTTPQVGRHPFTSRVQKVEFSISPYDYPKVPAAGQFYSLCGNAIYQWDVMHSKAPVRVEELDGAISSDSSWNPHYSDAPSLVAVGDLDGALRIVDLRSSSNAIVWSVNQSSGTPCNHLNGINSVKWSPFIPYWIASSGNDGFANIWDLRHNKLPMAQLSGPGGSVKSIDWSNTHSDILLGGSSDHRCYLWSLSQYTNPPPFQFGGRGILVKEGRAFTSSIVQVLKSDKNPDRFYAVSDVGELGWLEPNSIVLDIAAPIRTSQPELQECETLVFRRDMAAAGKKITELLASKKVNQAELELLCDATLGYPVDPARLALSNRPLDSTTFTDTLTPELRFSSDVNKFSYGVPTGFSRVPPLFYTPPPENFEKSASSTFSCRVRALINAQDTTGLFKLENEIINFLTNGYSPTSTELVTDITKLLLPKNCSATLKIATRILDSMINLQESKSSKSNLDLSGLAPLVYLILYPTVFDADPTKGTTPTTGSAPHTLPPARPQRSASRRNIKSVNASQKLSPRPSIRRANTGSPALAQSMIVKLLTSHPKSLLTMIQLEIDIQAVALRCGADSEKAGAVILHTVAKQFGVVSLPDAQPQHFTISSGALKLFLNAMVQLKRYEAYLLHATVLEKAFNGCEIALIISSQSSTIAAPKFKSKSETLLKDLNNEKNPQEIIQGEGFRSVLRCLLQIGVRYDFNCIELEVEYLKNNLSFFSEAYLQYLRRLTPGSGDLSSATKELITLFQLLTLDHHVHPKRTLSLPKLTGQESSSSLIQSFDILVKEILS